MHSSRKFACLAIECIADTSSRIANQLPIRPLEKTVSAGEVATVTGIDRKEVDKAFADLKKEGAIVSPVRCKWEPAK